jgi:environmental stress-induced protein Ves
MTILIPYASLQATAWKNGGGSTTEIAISPPGAGLDSFDWRISLATIASSGPFSVFEGIDRTLALVDGPGVTLDIADDGRFVLGEDQPVLEFAGEAQVSAIAGARPSTDFNVMTRRERCSHQLGRRSLSGTSGLATRADLTILFLAEGESLEVSSDEQRIAMVRYDAMLFEGDATWTLEAGRATIFIVDIYFHED